MEHKKILLATRPLVPPWDEASKNFAYFLAKSVSLPEISLHILTEKNEPRLENLSASVIEHPIYSNKYGKERAHYPFFQKIRLPIYLFFQSRNYDIIHYIFTPTFFNAVITRYLTPFSGKRVQTVATFRSQRYPKVFLKYLFFGNTIITYTERTKKQLEEIGVKNVTRIYPGIDLERYSPQPKNPALLTELGLTTEDFIVIYPGEYTRLGATDMLTETFLKYFKEHPETNLRFVFACRIKNDADALKKKEIHRKFAEAKLLDYVAFSDTITDMAGLYNTADVVIFPVADLKGKFDVPLIIIEAYACGKPVILSDLPQFSEFANDDICVTIPKDSGTQLMESLAYLKENEGEHIRLGNNARRFVKDHFDLKNTAKQYEEIYTSL